MNLIFLDTNYLVSYYIPTEKHHKRALEIYQEIKNKEKIISRSIIAETINILHNKIKVDFQDIKKVYKELNNKYHVIEDNYYYDRTIQRILKDKKRLPFFDNLYIVLMEDLGIKEIVSFDKHFNNIDSIERIH
jgi:predicted nucleic acid-binding protein